MRNAKLGELTGAPGIAGTVGMTVIRARLE